MILDIIVVNHRTPEYRLRCLQSLVEYLPDVLQGRINIFDIDNSPEAEQVGDIKIANRGYGQACNYGAALGDAPNILFLNADASMRSDSRLEEMLFLLSQVEDVAVLGPRQVDESNRITSAGCPMSADGKGYYIRGWQELDSAQYDEELLDCAYVPGSVLLAKRREFESVGGFLETELYYEETWLCYALRARGSRTCYTGSSRWLHSWDKSPKPDRGRVHRQVKRRSYDKFARRCELAGIQAPPFYPDSLSRQD